MLQRAEALATLLGCEPTEIDAVDDTRFGHEQGNERVEYEVLTESESDAAAREKLEGYEDAEAILKSVGHGYVLSSHDDEEHTVVVGGVCYYLYRMD